MKQLLITFTLLTVSIIHSFACLHTYQLKLFPVGISNNKIISVDIEIRRSSVKEENKYLKLDMDSATALDPIWLITSYITEYDKEQNLLKKDSSSFKCTFLRVRTLIPVFSGHLFPFFADSLIG